MGRHSVYDPPIDTARFGDHLTAQLSGLLCATKHGRLAACAECRQAGGILAKPFARALLAAIVPSYSFEDGKVVDLAPLQASAAGRALVTLAKLYNARINMGAER